tara:strand:- start:599 stop:1048 length:450 start_codon:yes stop_codon:yes gene_type:complete
MEADLEGIKYCVTQLFPNARFVQDHRKDVWDDAGYVVYAAEKNGMFYLGFEVASVYLDMLPLREHSLGKTFLEFSTAEIRAAFLTDVLKTLEVLLEEFGDDSVYAEDLPSHWPEIERYIYETLSIAYTDDKDINKSALLELVNGQKQNN